MVWCLEFLVLMVVNTVLLVVAAALWRAMLAYGAECNLKVIAECSDLCDPGLDETYVQAVIHSGPIAEFACVPPHLQVTLT